MIQDSDLSIQSNEWTDPSSPTRSREIAQANETAAISVCFSFFKVRRTKTVTHRSRSFS